MNEKIFRFGIIDHSAGGVLPTDIASSSAHAITTGSKAFTLAADPDWPTGLTVRARSAANALNYVEGTLTDVVENQVTINVTVLGKLTLTSLNETGGTATATKAGHGFTNGETVTIAGASPANYNGDFVISNVTANTFDYSVTGSPLGAATGTITACKTLGTDWLVKPTSAYVPSAAAGRLIELTLPRENKFRHIWCFYDNTQFVNAGDEAWLRLYNQGQLVVEFPAAVNLTATTRFGIANYPSSLGVSQAGGNISTNAGGAGVLWWDNQSGGATAFAVQPFRVVATADLIRLESNRGGNTRALLAVFSAPESP